MRETWREGFHGSRMSTPLFSKSNRRAQQTVNVCALLIAISVFSVKRRGVIDRDVRHQNLPDRLRNVSSVTGTYTSGHINTDFEVTVIVLPTAMALQGDAVLHDVNCLP